MTEVHKQPKPTPAGAVAFSIKTMAARTGLSRSYLYEALKDGRLKSFKIGRRRLTTPKHEAEFLALYQQADAA
ncbi:MAG TPA: excisionase family DNA-binding protein [Micropepsaceae bacterium]|nr:excisionase family DNA-binding protein [Micropepsaceae bacterium]